jgi:hypothetical protein
MPNTFAIRGQAAELRWGYHPAATLGAWSLDAMTRTFTASMLTVDDFKVSQRPLDVVTPNGWRWRIDTLQIVDGALTATLCPQRDAHGTQSVCSA